jgi:hypothetical protein
MVPAGDIVRSHSCLCFVSLLVCSALGVACNSAPADSASAGPSAAAAVQARASLVTPTLGGSVLAVGEQQVELAVLENGSVLGQVYDASGSVVAPAALPKVAVELRTQGGGRPRAELSWQPAQACLSGRAQLDAGLASEPINVSLDLNGKVSTASLSGYAILPFARFGGSVLAVGPHAVELVAKGNTVLAYVLEASGQARAGAGLALQLELAGGAPLALSWDAGAAHYRAQLDGKLDLSAQPLRLTLSAAGKSYVGAVSSLSAVAKARLAARAQLSAAGSARLDAPALDATAQLAAPSAALKGGAALKGSAALKATADVGASKLAAGKLAANQAVSARATAKAPSLKVSKAASASTSVKKPSAKASAGVKAGASFSLGK